MNKFSQFEFSDRLNQRIRRKKKMPGEEASDDPIIDPIDNFRVNTFYVCLDIINSAFKEYFGNGSIEIYKDLSWFSKKRLDEVKKKSSITSKRRFFNVL